MDWDQGIHVAKETTKQLMDKLVYNKHPATVTLIEILAVVGIVIWAAGYRLIRPCMFLAGFGLGFLLFYVLSPLVFKTQICCGPNGKQIAHILFSVLAGAFGGFLGCRLYRLGVFSIGECLGLIVGLTILSTPCYKYFHSNVAYAALMALTSLMFGSLAHFYEKPVVVLATSCAGALAVLYGVDYFVRTSFSVTVESFLLRIRDVVWDGMKSELSNWTYRAKIPDHLAVRFTSSSIPMFAAWSVSTAVGFVVQIKITANNLNSGSSLLQYCNCCDRPRPDK
ncbi:PREDICTED: uncharacterized protein LOC107357060 [Acropora digitifera]|uniref:uncharacterized protein LOC107357060 n=1 Tax=Acropora digitifera TaxID=70779 RepID=UPI00077AC6DB|nr:PREDICTED: uncharacterized protein LOC107357060 [Acropora digitifera]